MRDNHLYRSMYLPMTCSRSERARINENNANEKKNEELFVHGERERKDGKLFEWICTDTNRIMCNDDNEHR